MVPRLPVLLHMHNTYHILGSGSGRSPIPHAVEAFLACSNFVMEEERERLGTGAGVHSVMYNGVDPKPSAPVGKGSGGPGSAHTLRPER